MPDPSESPAALEHQLTDRLLAFDHLDAAWLRGRTAIEIGRQREDALSGIVSPSGLRRHRPSRDPG